MLEDLRDLPERQRGALVMRELSGLSHEEIASAFETSVGTAKQAISRLMGGTHSEVFFKQLVDGESY